MFGLICDIIVEFDIRIVVFGFILNRSKYMDVDIGPK